jgi:hypothetical protein
LGRLADAANFIQSVWSRGATVFLRRLADAANVIQCSLMPLRSASFLITNGYNLDAPPLTLPIRTLQTLTWNISNDAGDVQLFHLFGSTQGNLYYHTISAMNFAWGKIMKANNQLHGVIFVCLRCCGSNSLAGPGLSASQAHRASSGQPALRGRPARPANAGPGKSR